MKLETVTISYQRVFNLGNYESLRLECTLEASADEGETAEDVATTLYVSAKAIVKEQAMPVIRKRDDEIAAIKASVPGVET